jgi:hypothetical protein
MVHKRYIKRNGKLFGPYYYESYRVGDKVKKRYLGTEKDIKRKESQKIKSSKDSINLNTNSIIFTITGIFLVVFLFLFFNFI